MQFFRYFICMSVLLATAMAQNVQWTDAGTGDPADLQLVFEKCSPEGTPLLPDISGVKFSYRGQSDQFSIINFSSSRSVILSYRLQISTPGQVQIPSFKVKTDKGDLTVPAYATGSLKPGPETDIQSHLRPGRTTVWAGEVFPMVYNLDVARRNFSNFGGGIEWDPSPLLVEDWAKPEIAETTRSGESRLNVTFRTRGYLKTPGSIRIKPISQLINLAVGTSGFGLFQQQRIDQVSISTDQPSISVRPLPQPSPNGFTGAVGQFKLNSKVVPATAAVGEPITWTLELSGSGNWPDIAGLPSRSVSQDFQVIQPQAKRTVAEGKLFDATLSEDVVLVPTKPGTYTLGAVEFSYFDPQTGSYQTGRTPATTVTVTAAAVPRFNITPDASAQTPAQPTASITAPTPPSDPAGIPRDPLSGSEPVSTPFQSWWQMILWAGVPLVALGLLWLVLGYRRARQTDPLRGRRLARLRLLNTVHQLSEANRENQAKLLLNWQHDMALLCNVHHAAPAAAAIKSQSLTILWTEADRALYGEKQELTSDWIARAEAELSSIKISGTAWWRTFLPQNLFPFFVVLLCLTSLPALHGAPSAAAAYQSGDYVAAENAWRDAVEKTPTDWIARHNLSLALAQQENWGEAAAQATAAFVQNPQMDATRWNLQLAYSKAGYTPTAIGPLLDSSPRADLARLASPADWERLFVIACAGLTLALAVLLLLGYGIGPRWSKWPALLVIVAALLVISGSLVSRSAYGLAASPDAVIVWRSGTLYSIPTEADTTQQTASLSAGSMGTVDKTFLGWVRLYFTNGQTGWVRKSEIIAIWK
jgi:tetratricopeptide (TPR) repeat protein